jgi:hypothetical protein
VRKPLQADALIDESEKRDFYEKGKEGQDGVTPVAEGYSVCTFNAIRVPLSLVIHPIEENPTGDLYHQSLVA